MLLAKALAAKLNGAMSMANGWHAHLGIVVVAVLPVPAQ
jgi:hypothetical protein